MFPAEEAGTHLITQFYCRWRKKKQFNKNSLKKVLGNLIPAKLQWGGIIEERVCAIIKFAEKFQFQIDLFK